MNDKNNFPKRALITFLILVGIGVLYSIYITQLQNVSSKVTVSPKMPYGQTAISTIFAPTAQPPVVTLNRVYANPSVLRINLTISGLELVTNADDLENVVCDPYVNPDEPISLSLSYREAQIPIRSGDPIKITYEYSMDASGYESLTLNLDLTIGPCGPHFQESNVTPYPVDLIANYHLFFSVLVE